VAGYRLVPVSFGLGLQFACGNCARPTTIKLDDLQGPFTCRQCAKRLTVPTVACFYRASCSGTYATCGGVVQRLSAHELAVEEAKAWQGEAGSDGRPTDASLDDSRDVRGSIVSYECANCHARYTARQGTSLGFSWSGRSTCRRTVCGSCRRVPAADEVKGGG
jgi:hypothetical protein